MQTAASCKAKGAPAVDVHGVDLSKAAQVHKFSEDVLAQYKHVDVLVNNAGMGTSSGSGPVDGKLLIWVVSLAKTYSEAPQAVQQHHTHLHATHTGRVNLTLL